MSSIIIDFCLFDFKTDNKRKQLIKEAENFVKFSFSKVKITTEADNMGKNIIAYGK